MPRIPFAVVCVVGLTLLNGTGMLAKADPVDRSGALCDRSFSPQKVFDSKSGLLSPSEVSRLNQGAQISKFVVQPSGYYIGYIFQLTKYDPKFILGLFSSCGEHAGEEGLGDFVRESRAIYAGSSEISNPFKVYYEQQVDDPYENGRYTVLNKVGRVANSQGVESYGLDSRLIDSSDASFSPRWVDAYLRTYSMPSGTLVIACNYMVPRGGRLWRKRFNGMAEERLKKTGENLLRWANRVSRDGALAESYRRRLERLLKE
ncbi:MAG: hypothetical protein AB1540_09570 [Bdellovibrionota bacterium]